MKKIIVISSSVLFLQTAIAQSGIQGLIQAEKNFAAYSVQHSTKEAFLAFTDSNSIMFDSSRAIKAIDFWNKREKRTSILNWWPQYAEISASGNFGYTTGPWTFQPSANDTVVAGGRYITVWHLTDKGEWKFLVDLGVSNTPADSVKDVIEVNAFKINENTKAIPHIYPLVAAENNFIQTVTKNKKKAYRQYLSPQSILNRNGKAQAGNTAQQQIAIDSTINLTYKMDGWDVSSLPDMGYTYGTTVSNGKSENYLRIWRREKTGWKIAVEVLRY
jgi:ketosteroid isomerase-like protein